MQLKEARRTLENANRGPSKKKKEEKKKEAAQKKKKKKKGIYIWEGRIFLTKNLPLCRNNLHKTGNQVKVGLQQEANMAIPRKVRICKAMWKRVMKKHQKKWKNRSNEQ